MSTLTISRLNRFPIKGLSAEPLASVALRVAEGIPGDRFYGFARYNSGFDPSDPKPLPKDQFVVLLKEAGLASMQTRFFSEKQILEITYNGNTFTFDMRSPKGCADSAAFLHKELALTDPQPPTFVSSEPHRFTDVSVVSPVMMNAISVLNVASIEALSQRLGAKVHPARFRANIEVEGLPPFAEQNAIGSTLTFGDVALRLLQPTKRCAATEVNPETTERDLDLPYLLRKHLGHMNMGVYVEVVKPGELFLGQSGQLLT